MSEPGEGAPPEEEPRPASEGAPAAAAAAPLPPRWAFDLRDLRAPGRGLPGWLTPRFAYREVSALGCAWPRAASIERCFWAFWLVSCVAVLAIAAFVVEPDGRGVGTHEQLGLPPCGFVASHGGPCPSCGFTTTYALAAHGRPLEAVANQPFGFLLFLLTLLAVPATALSVARGVSLFAISERWPWVRLLTLAFALWLLAWGYKWWSLAR